MTIRKLLVFGATGTQGHPVVDAALEAGFEVRAATRDVHEAEEKLPGRVEVVEADLNVFEAVREAMTGADAVFFHLPILPEESSADAIVDNVVKGATQQGLQRIVFTTGGYCGDDMPPGVFVDAMRGISRRILAADVPAIILRPTLYLANLVWPHVIRQIREYGRLTYPPLSGKRRLNWTATEDQGRIVAACLKTGVADEVIDIASPEPVNGPDLCRLLANVYGREVHFAPQTIEDFADTLSHLTGSAPIGRTISALYADIDAFDGDGPLVDTDALERRFDVELIPVSRWVEDRLGRLIQLYG